MDLDGGAAMVECGKDTAGPVDSGGGSSPVINL